MADLNRRVQDAGIAALVGTKFICRKSTYQILMSAFFMLYLVELQAH